MLIRDEHGHPVLNNDPIETIGQVPRSPSFADDLTLVLVGMEWSPVTLPLAEAVERAALVRD